MWSAYKVVRQIFAEFVHTQNIGYTFTKVQQRNKTVSQSFHKLKSMKNFYKEFIFVVIERINTQISTFRHFCDRKKQFAVILMYSTRFYVIVFSAFRNLKDISCKAHHSHTLHQNNIKFSFLITKKTKC